MNPPEAPVGRLPPGGSRRPRGGPSVDAPIAARAGVAGLVALVALEILWETLLAPVHSGSYWLALKALPLALLVPGTMRGARRARQWLVLMLPFYAAEGIVRAWSESGRSAIVAAVVTLLAIGTFAAALAWFREK
jgi:uncharacterized membrane protein